MREGEQESERAGVFPDVAKASQSHFVNPGCVSEQGNGSWKQVGHGGKEFGKQGSELNCVSSALLLLEYDVKRNFMESQINILNAAKFSDFSVSFRRRFCSP